MFSKYTKKQLEWGMKQVHAMPRGARDGMSKQDFCDMLDVAILEGGKRWNEHLQQLRVEEEAREALKVRRENHRLAMLALDLQKLGVVVNPSKEVLAIMIGAA